MNEEPIKLTKDYTANAGGDFYLEGEIVTAMETGENLGYLSNSILLFRHNTKEFIGVQPNYFKENFTIVGNQ